MRTGTNTFLFLLLLCQCNNNFFAQNRTSDYLLTKVDSLSTVLQFAKEDTNRVTTLNLLSKALWRTANSQQGMKYAEEALVLAKKLNFNRGVIYAYENIGSHYEYQGNYPEALKNHFTALKMVENLKDKNEIAACYILISQDYEEQGKTHPNDSLREELFSEAQKYNFAALKLIKETGDKRYECSIYNTFGSLYQHQDNDSEALKNYFAALKIAEELGWKRAIAIISSNIGTIYRDWGEHDKALEMAFKAMKAATEIGDRRDISLIYIDIGRVYINLKENSKARWHLNQGLAIAKEVGNKEGLVRCYKILSGLDDAEGNWKDAYFNYKLFTLYRDSLNNEENSKKFVQTQMQYEFDKKEDSLKQKQLVTEIKVQAQAKQKNFYLIGAILFALLSVFVFLNFRNQRKVNRLMNVAYEKERAELELHSLRAQLNPHFMFNSLNAIQELILKEDFDNSHTYLARFAKLLRMLLENAEKPFVSLNSEIDFLQLYLSLERLRIPDLTFSVTVDPSINTGETLLPNMVLQPYIENALWHGLSQKSGDKNLELIIHKQNGAVIYNVKDNGVGRKKAAELKSLYRKEHKSKGMELLTRRFKLLNEEFGFEIKTQVNDVMNDGEVAGTLVSINVPDSIAENLKTQL